jgi:uncharacterized protein (TIGR02466 family)
VHLVEHHDLFPVPVWHGALDGFGEHQAALVELVRREREASSGLRVSNQGGFRSAEDFHRLDSAAARYLSRSVLEFAVRALHSVTGGFAGKDLALTHCWANIDGPGHWHTPHCHYPSPWSGVAYVAAEGCASPDPEQRAGKIELLNPLPAPEAFGQPTGITFTPRDGSVLLFPGLLKHMVHPHQTAAERISVSFNLNVVPRG